MIANAAIWLVSIGTGGVIDGVQRLPGFWYAKAGPLTLLTAARDLPHAHPTVLADVLEEPAHRRD